MHLGQGFSSVTLFVETRFSVSPALARALLSLRGMMERMRFLRTITLSLFLAGLAGSAIGCGGTEDEDTTDGDALRTAVTAGEVGECTVTTADGLKIPGSWKPGSPTSCCEWGDQTKCHETKASLSLRR